MRGSCDAVVSIATPAAAAMDPGLCQTTLLRWNLLHTVQNGRWAMLGAAGVLFPEVLSNLGTGGPAAQQAWCAATISIAEACRIGLFSCY